MEKREKNKGFTLVELIIAVAILGIAFGPLISNFLQAARINKKSREELAATTMAQNIMEGMSAYKSDALIKAFETYEQGKSLSVLPTGITCASYGENIVTPGAFYINSSGANGTSKYTKQVTDSTVVTGAGMVIQRVIPTNIIVQDDHKYEFFVTDVKGQINGDTAAGYDLKITLDGSDHSGNANVYNSKDGIDIASVNGLYDCIWQDTQQDVENAIERLRDSITSTDPMPNPTKIASHLSRELTVDIYDKEYGIGENFCVEFTDKYGASYTDTNSAGNLVTYNCTPYTTTTTKFSSQDTGKNPRNIYIYYWPSYLDDYATYRDKIVINNQAGLKVDVYLVRMSVEATSYTRPTNSANEENYKMDLVLKSNYTGVYPAGRTDDFKGRTIKFNDYEKLDTSGGEELRNDVMTVHTNAYENIAKTHAEVVSSAGLDLYNPNRVNLNCAEYNGNDGSLISASIPKRAEIIKEIVLGLYGKKVSDNLYDLTVEVYKEGAKATGFQEADRLVSFTGAVTN